MRVFRSSFFKIPRHSKFDYQPRYSESIDESSRTEERRITFERGKSFGDKSPISGKLRRSVIAFRKRESQRRKMRIYILLGALIIVLLILLQNL